MEKKTIVDFEQIVTPSSGARVVTVQNVTLTTTQENTRVIPVHRILIGVPWTSESPDLTVPDLADSPEAMIARREAGVSQRSTLLMQTQYPVDPHSRYTAVKLLQDIQANAKAELEVANAKIQIEQLERARIAEERKAEAAQFVEFKNSKKTQG